MSAEQDAYHELCAYTLMRAEEGPTRDRSIHAWCDSVRAAFADSRETVVALLREHAII